MLDTSETNELPVSQVLAHVWRNCSAVDEFASGCIHKWSPLKKELPQHCVMCVLFASIRTLPVLWGANITPSCILKPVTSLLLYLSAKGRYQAEADLGCFEELFFSSENVPWTVNDVQSSGYSNKMSRFRVGSARPPQYSIALMKCAKPKSSSKSSLENVF